MTAPRSTSSSLDDDPTSISGVVDLVKTYVKQETLGPLKGAGRWLGMGAAGAVLLGLGLTIVLLGVLRLIQAEWSRSATGSLSWIPYLIVLVLCLLLLLLTLSRINRDSLNKEQK
ncbi:MAG: phage holin family protein [Ilumatobacteraceae bacterium]